MLNGVDYHGIGIFHSNADPIFYGTCSMQNNLTSVTILVSGCSNLGLNHIYYKQILSRYSWAPFIC